ncbi:MAG: fumarylacetoacetase [Alphaproteobacteria bacterium]|nr:fumarylacetoacetase [Alphaproteobacteria bacterium]
MNELDNPIQRSDGFGIDNLPYAVFSAHNQQKRIGVRLGTKILDLGFLEESGLIPDTPRSSVFNSPNLNALAELGPVYWLQFRLWLKDFILNPASGLQQKKRWLKALVPLDQITLYLPFQTRGYTDFYASEQHARNVGALYRDPANALLKNWKHLPVAYHGRSSSLVISGTPITRPHGQILMASAGDPAFQPSRKLDFEIEVGFYIGQGNQLGWPIPIETAEQHIFGLVLVNDWSARDIQSFEYQPLGPFLGKNFATSVSPWVVPWAALQPFRQAMPQPDIPVAAYLAQANRSTFNIPLKLTLKTASGYSQTIIKTNFANQYWSMAQQIAHHTINGCNLEIGDLLASGTISGTEPNSWGSLLEISQDGRQPLQLANGENRSFLADGDEVTISAVCQNSDKIVSFGEVKGKILPSLSL